jgi:hypothetical protein
MHVTTENHVSVVRCDIDPSGINCGAALEGRFDLVSHVHRLDAKRDDNGVRDWLTNATASFVKGSVIQAISVFLTFYLLFYFLRDQREALRSLR